MGKKADKTPLQLDHVDAELAATWYAKGKIDAFPHLGLTYADAHYFGTLYADTRGKMYDSPTETNIASAFHRYAERRRTG